MVKLRVALVPPEVLGAGVLLPPPEELDSPPEVLGVVLGVVLPPLLQAARQATIISRARAIASILVMRFFI